MMPILRRINDIFVNQFIRKYTLGENIPYILCISYPSMSCQILFKQFVSKAPNIEGAFQETAKESGKVESNCGT